MTTQDFALKMHFAFVLPIFGGLAVAYAFYDLFHFSLAIALLGAALFGYIAAKLRPSGISAKSWSQAAALLLVGTIVIALIPIAFGVTFLLVDWFGSFPALSLATLAALGTMVFAFWVRKGASGPPLASVHNRGTPPENIYAVIEQITIRTTKIDQQ